MFKRISEWLDDALGKAMKTGIPDEVIAFGFNLYEDGDYHWSMELIGTSEFDEDDEGWLCNEVTDFGTREKPFRWLKKAKWNEILSDIICVLKEYLNNGEFADVLMEKSGIGVGFVDGDVEILYTK